MNSEATSIRVKQLVVLIIGMALLVYSIVRATTMSLTIDEAFTYIAYVKSSSFFPTEYIAVTANFHMLNTWGMIVCSKLFGSAEWSIRLPNVIAHLLFLFFTAKLALRSKSVWNATAIFILLNCHPYLLDFFSVARGYGLSFGFLAGAMWFLLRYVDDEKKRAKNLVLSLVFGGLAMWGSFVVLQAYLALAAVLGIIILVQNERVFNWKQKLGQLALLLLTFTAFLAVALPVIMHMQEAQALRWGTNDFWNVSIRGLAALLGYEIKSEMFMTGQANEWSVIIVLALSVALIVYALVNREKTEKNNVLLAFTGVLVISILSVVLQNVLLGTPFPYARTGLFMFVLFVFAIAVALRDTMIPRFVSLTVCMATVSFQLFYALPALNFRHTLEWQYCEDTKQVITDLLEKEYKSDPVHPGITISSDLEFGNTVAYYLRLKNVQNVSLINCVPGNSEPADYYVVSKLTWHEVPLCDTLREYPASGLMLLRNRSLPVLHLQQGAAEISNSICALKVQEDRCWLCTHVINAADSGMGRLNFTATVTFPTPTSAALFLIWHNRDGKDYWGTFVACDAPENGNESTVTVSRPLPQKVQTGDEIKVELVPYQHPGGSYEISDVSSSFYVEKPAVAE